MKKILFALAALAVLALSSCTIVISTDPIIGDWSLYSYNSNPVNDTNVDMNLSVSVVGSLSGTQWVDGDPTDFTGSWSKSGGTYYITTNSFLSSVGDFTGSLSASGKTLTLDDTDSADVWIFTKN